MTQHRYLSLATAAAALTFLASACSDNDKWEPGPDVDPDCMGVYFGEMPTYKIILEPDDSRLIPVTIGRNNTEKIADIDIVTDKCPQGVVVPSSVHFDAGEQSTIIYIDLENMASKSQGELALSFPEGTTSPYGAGTETIALDITVSGAWIPVSNNVTASISSLAGDRLYPDLPTKLYNLDGTDNFKIPNFLNSGVDFIFTGQKPGNGYTAITPIKNYIDMTDDGWWLYDDANAKYPVWTPDGVTYPEIRYIEFLTGYNIMQLITDADNNGYIYLSPYFYFSDETGKYVDIYFTFKTEFTPYSD